ncbi:MAG: DNA processing protein, partial [Myxococcota bacterium]
MEELRARLILTVAAINPRMVHALITDSASGPGAKGSAVMALERGNLTDRVRQLAADKKTLLEVDRSMKRAEELGARWLMPGDEEFPEELTDTPLLSIRGSWHRGTSVGIVGSREADEYGRTVARSLARALATVRISVVSGAARGIDEAAHLGALDIVNGHTVAVLGTGLAGDRNPRKRQLLDKIAEQGAVISEYSTEYRGSPFSFPQRNRLIARLSKAVVVAQAF